MSIFKIIKKAPNSFWHLYNNGSKEVNLSDFEVVLDSMAQTFNIQCLNGANIPNQSVQIADIRVIDQTAGSLEESFANVSTLKDRLTTLGYTPYKSSTGIEEAPVDGNTYGRKNEGWITITSGGGSLFALPFTTNHLTATGNQYTVGNVVFYNGNVYRCIAANDSILPTNTLYWTNLGAGYPLVQEPADWNSTSGNNQILNKPTILTTPTLQQVLDNNHDLVNGLNFQGSSAGDNNTGIFVNALGQDAANANTGTQVNALGTEAAIGNTGGNVNALGNGAAGFNTGNSVNALGDNAGYENIANNVNAMGTGSARSNSGDQINAFGTDACFENLGVLVNAFGTEAGYQNTGNNSNFLGEQAGSQNTGESINALGAGAGLNNTFDNVNLFGANANADDNGQTVLSKDGSIMARISTENLTTTHKYKLPDADGEFAMLSDITTPTLQQVTDEGNETTNSIIVENWKSKNNNNILGVYEELGTNKTATLKAQPGITNLSEWEIKPYSGVFAFESDITTPTLQDVTDEGNTTNNSIIVNGNNEISVNFGNNLSAVYSNSISTNNNTVGSFAFLSSDGNLGLGNSLNYQTSISANNLTNNAVNFELPNKTTGTYTLATTADIPTGGGGIPHATASGTDTYTVTITGVTAYNDADAFLIRFTNGNTTGATLNINSLGAKTLYRNNDGALIGGDIINGGEMLCIYNTSLNGFQLIGTAPNSLFAYVTNDDSVTITKGMPVYAFSGTGDRMTVKRANNTGDATSAQTVGLVLSTSIAAGQKGLIIMQGLLDGLSILPTSTFADGDAVYLGATAGTITNVKPHAPNHLVYLGFVTTASNGSAGRLYVRVQNGYELSELHNVQAQNPTLNDTLWYDNTVSPAQWKTASIPTILGYTPPNLGLVQAMTQGLQNIF